MKRGRKKQAWKCGHSDCVANRKEMDRLLAENLKMCCEMKEMEQSINLTAASNEILRSHIAELRAKIADLNRQMEQVQKHKSSVAKILVAAAHDLM